MKAFIAALLSISLIFSPIVVHADDNKSIDDIGEVVAPLKKNQPAPFNGVLFSPRAAAKISVDASTLEEKVNLAIERTLAESSAKCDMKLNQEKIRFDADKKVLQAQLDAEKREKQLITDRLKKEEDSKQDAVFWLGGGFLGGMLASVLVIIATK